MYPRYFAVIGSDCKVMYDGVGGKCSKSFCFCNFLRDDLELSN